MAKLEPSRYLLLGKSPSTDWGWWYQFIHAAAIETVLAGTLVHGWRRLPALKIIHTLSGSNEEDERVETVLSFEDNELLFLAWADLTQEMRERPTIG